MCFFIIFLNVSNFSFDVVDCVTLWQTAGEALEMLELVRNMGTKSGSILVCRFNISKSRSFMQVAKFLKLHSVEKVRQAIETLLLHYESLLPVPVLEVRQDLRKHRNTSAFVHVSRTT